MLDFREKAKCVMKSPPPTSVVRFGTYEVSLQSGEVRKAGLRIRVQQQPMKLLEILLEHPGEVVTREELRSRIWADENFGDFDQAVNIAIAKLRSALGDSAENPRYIETLPKRGYRFIAEVSIGDFDGRTNWLETVPSESSPRTSASSPLITAAPDLPLQAAHEVAAPKRRQWTAQKITFAALILGLSIVAVFLGLSSVHRPSGIR